MTGPSKEQMREFLISDIIDYMVSRHVHDFGFTVEQAMDRVYRSETVKRLQIPEGELYVQSPDYVLELLISEQVRKA